MTKYLHRCRAAWCLAVILSGALAGIGSVGPSLGWAQEGSLAVPAVGDGAISVPSLVGTEGLPPRDLAPGVLITVEPDQNADDTAIGPVDLEFVKQHPELAWTNPDFPENGPNFASPSETLLEMGRQVTLRHPVWGIEFSFKPMRMIEVDLPQRDGTMQRKLVWYLVYRLRYVGGDLYPELEDEFAGTGIAKKPKEVVFKSVRFLPRFTLINTQTKIEKDSQILSTAIPAIAGRERVGKPLLDDIQIAREPIQPSVGGVDRPVWGVATWTDIDPSTDFFIVQIKGLTNAYRVRTDASGKHSFQRKTLQLHFWRPGDTIAQAEDRIRLGVPAFVDTSSLDYALKQFGLEKRLDYQWIYR